jgi:hypothetical protein
MKSSKKNNFKNFAKKKNNNKNNEDLIGKKIMESENRKKIQIKKLSQIL